jgi:hypothetical protein
MATTSVRIVPVVIAMTILANAQAADTAATAAPARLPAAVAADVKSNADMCREVGGKPETRDAVKLADLNADGIADYVFFLGWMSCEGAASLYGDRDKGVSVYVGDGKGGATAAWSGSAFDAKIEGSGSSAQLWLDVMGQSCGHKPAADFASENFCSRALAWNAKSRKFDFAPVSTVRMIR